MREREGEKPEETVRPEDGNHFPFTVPASFPKERSHARSLTEYCKLTLLTMPGFGGAKKKLVLSRFVKAAVQVSHSSRILRAGSANSDGDTSTDDSSSEDEANSDLKTLTAQGDLPQDFWQVS